VDVETETHISHLAPSKLFARQQERGKPEVNELSPLA
jgi:hypothetical protein